MAKQRRQNDHLRNHLIPDAQFDGHVLWHQAQAEAEEETEESEVRIMDGVVHCKKSKYDVYIGRPSKWGNPFEIGRDGTRVKVIQKYEDWIQTQPKLMEDLPELKNKALGCWCAPKPCHGEVLRRLSGDGWL